MHHLDWGSNLVQFSNDEWVGWPITMVVVFAFVSDRHHRCISLGQFYSYIIAVRPIGIHWSKWLGASLIYGLFVEVFLWKYRDSDIYDVTPADLCILGILLDCHIPFRDLTWIPLSPVQKYVSILTIQHYLLIPMNMCANDVRIDERPNLLHSKYKFKSCVVTSQYQVEYNLLTTLKLNDSNEIPNA